MASIEAVLADHTTIGLDSNIFIYLFEKHSTYFPMVESIFTYLKQPDTQGITSIVTLIETCVQPQREGRNDLVQVYEKALLQSNQVQTLSITPPLAKRALILRALYNLRIPDALQIAAALESRATLFITNDLRLKQVTELTISTLDEITK